LYIHLEQEFFPAADVFQPQAHLVAAIPNAHFFEATKKWAKEIAFAPPVSPPPALRFLVSASKASASSRHTATSSANDMAQGSPFTPIGGAPLQVNSKN
jgi:hypothetical protein